MQAKRLERGGAMGRYGSGMFGERWRGAKVDPGATLRGFQAFDSDGLASDAEQKACTKQFKLECLFFTPPCFGPIPSWFRKRIKQRCQMV